MALSSNRTSNGVFIDVMYLSAWPWPSVWWKICIDYSVLKRRPTDGYLGRAGGFSARGAADMLSLGRLYSSVVIVITFNLSFSHIAPYRDYSRRKA